MAMAKPDLSIQYERFRALMIKVRKAKRVPQWELAQRIGRSQSYVAKYEGGRRRLDVVEFIDVAKALHVDPWRIIRRLTKELGQQDGPQDEAQDRPQDGPQDGPPT
jgi:transcriptional regulator with XRE-family HTH domain